MSEEIYSFDKYKGYSIFVIFDNNMYYGEVTFNGTGMIQNIKSNSPEGCLSKCKSWVDKENADA